MRNIKDIPVNERPYERCLANGPEYLTDSELLAVILRTGTKGISAYDLSSELLKGPDNKENLLSILHLSKEQLLKIKGIGKVKAVQIMCIGELSKRIATIGAKSGIRFKNPATIADYYMEQMRHLEQEQLVVMYFDTKCSLIKDKILTTGTINQSLISSREIFVEALKCNAVNIVLVHNHPSGNCVPSRDDCKVTKKIQEAGKLIGINLIDHIIIGDRKYTSLKESGILS